MANINEIPSQVDQVFIESAAVQRGLCLIEDQCGLQPGTMSPEAILDFATMDPRNVWWVPTKAMVYGMDLVLNPKEESDDEIPF